MVQLVNLPNCDGMVHVVRYRTTSKHKLDRCDWHCPSCLQGRHTRGTIAECINSQGKNRWSCHLCVTCKERWKRTNTQEKCTRRNISTFNAPTVEEIPSNLIVPLAVLYARINLHTSRSPVSDTPSSAIPALLRARWLLYLRQVQRETQVGASGADDRQCLNETAVVHALRGVISLHEIFILQANCDTVPRIQNVHGEDRSSIGWTFDLSAIHRVHRAGHFMCMSLCYTTMWYT